VSSVAALLVTHNSAAWIEQTLASVAGQNRPVDAVVVIDDGSSDGTLELLRTYRGLQVHAATATSTDTITRIAQNFRQGLRACSGLDVVVLGDHDDVWHVDRVQVQVERLLAHRDVVMVASDGRLVDEAGHATGGTLRTAFPVPADFEDLPPAQQMSAAIRRSVATGGASAVRPEAFADQGIPDGWLHDRWWSLLALSREAFVLDESVVIDYRLSAEQEVGLASGHQAQSLIGRVGSGVASLPATLGKMGDLHSLANGATEATRPELSGWRLLRNLA
jgi:glycosyltransferase involved in cell wall biosynthesis